MAKYSIQVTRAAEMQLAAIAQADQIRILKRVKTLADDPFPGGCRKLQGYDDAFRVRVGNYRIIYTLEDAVLTIAILKIGRRRDVYR